MVTSRMPSHYLDNLPEVDVAVMLAHPGDAEFYCGGAIAGLAAQGKRVAILDLTAGEAGSMGRKDIKLDEADEAAKILGVTWRGQMGMPDARIEDTIMSRMTVTGEIKRLRPHTVVAIDAGHRHPDSVAASLLVENGAYLAGLNRLDNYLEAHHVSRVVFAGLSLTTAPAFVADITAHYEQKRAALAAYTTLFADVAAAMEKLDREARYYGELIGVKYGEGYGQRGPLPGALI
jgi:N-acetylglucosamine malate deacetylase 1